MPIPALATKQPGCLMMRYGCRSNNGGLFCTLRAPIACRARGRTVPKASNGNSSGQGASEVASGGKLSSNGGTGRAEGTTGHSKPPAVSDDRAVTTATSTSQQQMDEEELQRINTILAAVNQFHRLTQLLAPKDVKSTAAVADPLTLSPAAWQQLGSLQAEVSELRRLARAGGRQILRLEEQVAGILLLRLSDRIPDYDNRLRVLEAALEKKSELLLEDAEDAHHGEKRGEAAAAAAEAEGQEAHAAVAGLRAELEGREERIIEMGMEVRGLRAELAEQAARTREVEAERDVVVGELRAEVRALKGGLEGRDAAIDTLGGEVERLLRQDEVERLEEEVWQCHALIKSLLENRRTGEVEVEEGDVVRIRRVPLKVARTIQAGRWDPYMERLLGETGSVAGPATADGMVPVLMDVGDGEGEPVLWHPWLLHLITPAFNAPALPLGTRVCIRGVSVEEAKRLQRDWRHGGWRPERARMLGKTGIVVDEFPDGDMKVALDGEPKGSWWWHRLLVVALA